MADEGWHASADLYISNEQEVYEYVYCEDVAEVEGEGEVHQFIDTAPMKPLEEIVAMLQESVISDRLEKLLKTNMHDRNDEARIESADILKKLGNVLQDIKNQVVERSVPEPKYHIQCTQTEKINIANIEKRLKALETRLGIICRDQKLPILDYVYILEKRIDAYAHNNKNTDSTQHEQITECEQNTQDKEYNENTQCICDFQFQHKVHSLTNQLQALNDVHTDSMHLNDRLACAAAEHTALLNLLSAHAKITREIFEKMERKIDFITGLIGKKLESCNFQA